MNHPNPAPEKPFSCMTWAVPFRPPWRWVQEITSEESYHGQNREHAR